MIYIRMAIIWILYCKMVVKQSARNSYHLHTYLCMFPQIIVAGEPLRTDLALVRWDLQFVGALHVALQRLFEHKCLGTDVTLEVPGCVVFHTLESRMLEVFSYNKSKWLIEKSKWLAFNVLNQLK